MNESVYSNCRSIVFLATSALFGLKSKYNNNKMFFKWNSNTFKILHGFKFLAFEHKIVGYNNRTLKAKAEGGSFHFIVPDLVDSIRRVFKDSVVQCLSKTAVVMCVATSGFVLNSLNGYTCWSHNFTANVRPCTSCPRPYFIPCLQIVFNIFFLLLKRLFYWA